MSRLDELISKLCPDGVNYLPIGELATYEQPGKYIVQNTDYDDSYETPVLTAGQTFVLGYTNETDGVYQASKDNPVIIFDDFTGSFKWVDFPFKVKSSAVKMLQANEEITSLRYLFHVMSHLRFLSSEHKRLWISIYSQFKIPVPPLEVQLEIVGILDKFTELTTELTAELTNELRARKKQYLHIRKNLLGLYISVEREENKYSLKEVCDFQNGFAFKSSLFKDEGLPILRIQNITGGKISDGSYVRFSKEDYSVDLDRYLVKKGDIVVAMSGATTGKIGINNTNTELYLNQRVGLFRPFSEWLDREYLNHWLSEQSDNIYRISAGTGAQPNLSSKRMMEFELFLPPIAVQKNISKVLNKLESLFEDYSNGITKEINKRSLQYEYYRDKLLTFKELSA